MSKTLSAFPPAPSPSPAADAAAFAHPVIVVGSGPVGLRVAQELQQRRPQHAVWVFGDEAHAPYSRVKLSSWLAGDIAYEGLAVATDFVADAAYRLEQGRRIVRIDVEQRCVIDHEGLAYTYSDLVLATGSRARIPDLPGMDLPGVYTFRDILDAAQLFARQTRSRHTVVLGGGLLGLETARAMRRLNTQVTVLDHSDYLMHRQLDYPAAERLTAAMAGLGITVRTQVALAEVYGDHRVEGVRLRSGETLACDTVVLAVGIVPRVELALAAKISVGRGIRVDDHLQTSVAHIYAVGDCAEHRDVVYGLVAPGYEQAAVAAHVITGGEARYTGTTSATRLKVVGVPVMSVGLVAEARPTTARQVSFSASGKGGDYRAVVVERGRLVGAIGVGTWAEASRVQEAVTYRRRVWPWQLARLRSRGQLWPETAPASVSLWPATAVVCNCTGVTRGRLDQAICDGARSLQDLSAGTGAATVCGSCKPHLQELLGDAAGVEPEADARWLWACGALAGLLLALIIFPTNIPYPSTQAVSWHWDVLWRSSFAKQVSGFSLLGVSVVLAIVSLRKRLAWLRTWGDFSVWRALHVVFGALLLIGMIVHSGGRLGSNLNFALAAGMLMAAGFGSLASVSIAKTHDRTHPLRAWRAWALTLHQLALWPLPVLLAFHILKTYWY